MDEVQPEKRGPGRPRKTAKPETEAAPVAASTTKYKMKAKPNWEEVDPTAEDTPDRYKIPASVMQRLPSELSFQWITDSIFGQSDPRHRGGFEKNGWTPVHQGDFDGVLDGVFMLRGQEGEINVGGAVLMARPRAMTEKAQARDRALAREAIAIKERALKGGDIPVTLDARHASAVNTNRIGRSFETIPIPEK